MALTYSLPGELGSACPPVDLPAVDGQRWRLDDASGAKVLVFMFICGHCPYVQAVEDRLIALNRDFTNQPVRFVGICANDPADHPEDAPAELLTRWSEKNYGFPYLIDANQSAAKAFGAVCTPDFFVYDEQRCLRYRGRLDDSWRDPGKVTRQDMKEAIQSILDSHPVNKPQIPSMGCSIKWKSDV